MTIWFSQINCDVLNVRGSGTLADFMQIKFVKVGDDYLECEMPVTEKIKQPIGIVHGGANVVLAETIASTAANAVLNLQKEYAVGLEINANHIRSVKQGVIHAITRPIHLGKKTQIWHIELSNDHGELTCISRMTAAIIQVS